MSAENSLRIGGGFTPPANLSADRENPLQLEYRDQVDSLPAHPKKKPSGLIKRGTTAADCTRSHPYRHVPVVNEPPLTAMRPASTQCWQNVWSAAELQEV
jgi:hypothetical protein